MVVFRVGSVAPLIGRKILPFLYNHAGQPKVRQCTIPQKWYNCTLFLESYSSRTSSLLHPSQNGYTVLLATCYFTTPLFVVPLHFQYSPHTFVAINTPEMQYDHLFEFRKLSLWWNDLRIGLDLMAGLLLATAVKIHSMWSIQRTNSQLQHILHASIIVTNLQSNCQKRNST